MTTKRFILVLLVMLGSVTGAWAQKLHLTKTNVSVNYDYSHMGEGSDNAFDNDLNTIWDFYCESGNFVEFKTDFPVLPGELKLLYIDTDNSITNFKLIGAAAETNDWESQDELINQSGLTTAQVEGPFTVNCSQEKRYQVFRLYFYDRRGLNTIKLKEIELYVKCDHQYSGTPSTCSKCGYKDIHYHDFSDGDCSCGFPHPHQFNSDASCTVCGYSVSDTYGFVTGVNETKGGSTPTGDFMNLFDGDNDTKWTARPTAVAIFNTAVPSRLKGYSFSTNLIEGRPQVDHPRSWKLYGLDELSDTWEELHSVTDASVGNGWNNYRFRNDDGPLYSYYKLEITNIYTTYYHIPNLNMGEFVLDIHNHNYEWVIDEHQHKQVCRSEEGACGAREKNVGTHVYNEEATPDNEEYYTCRICRYIDLVRQHVHNYSWSSDGTRHWYECTTLVGTCTAREIDKGEHSYIASDTDDSANYTCSVCEYVDEDKKAPYDARDYMNFTAVGGDVTIGIDSEENPTCVLQYSLDRNHWANYATKDKGNIVTLQEGETCYFRTASPTVQTTTIDIKYNPYTKSYSADKRWWFTMSGAGTIEADGNAMSLIDQTCQSLTVGQFCFYGIFEGCSLLTVAPKLPATTLGESCYSLMFADCTNLRKAPHLPATSLPFECYNYMFAGCTSLDYVEADFTRTIQHKDTYYDRMVDTSFRETTDGWLEGTVAEGNLAVNRRMLGTWTDDVDLPQGWRKALKIKANEDPDHKGKFYATYYDSWEFGLTSDFTAYYGKIVSGEGGDELRLTPLDYGVIPRESGVIICSNKPDVVLPCNRVATHSPISQDDSDLTGTNADASAPANCYILSYGQDGLAFYKYAQGKTLAAHKAYLVYDRPAGAPAFRMVFEDEEETGISPLPASPKGEEMIYNLQGIRLDKLQKGINIVNGKKVLVK